jgi:hypothetical protein
VRLIEGWLTQLSTARGASSSCASSGVARASDNAAAAQWAADRFVIALAISFASVPAAQNRSLGRGAKSSLPPGLPFGSRQASLVPAF